MQHHIPSRYIAGLRIAANLASFVAVLTAFVALITAPKEHAIGAVAMCLCVLLFVWFLLKRSRGDSATLGAISVSDEMNQDEVAENDLAALWLTAAYSILLLFMLGVIVYRYPLPI